MATFLANKINIREGDVTGPTAPARIMYPSKDKECRVFEDIFVGRR